LRRLRFGAPQRAPILVGLGLWHEALGEQLLAPLRLAARQRQVRLRLVEAGAHHGHFFLAAARRQVLGIGPRRLDPCLRRPQQRFLLPAAEDQQHLAGLDHLPLMGHDGRNRPGARRRHIHIVRLDIPIPARLRRRAETGNDDGDEAGDPGKKLVHDGLPAGWMPADLNRRVTANQPMRLR
jgi:hypothetical protein